MVGVYWGGGGGLVVCTRPYQLANMTMDDLGAR